jgi:hypothetical protein
LKRIVGSVVALLIILGSRFAIAGAGN